jgi:hypothetical protein
MKYEIKHSNEKIVPLIKSKITPPVVYYSPKVLQLIELTVAVCDKEVGWLGTAEKVGNDYIIDEIFVPKQKVSGTETDISPETVGELLYEIVKKDKDPSKLIYWGHSHVNMGVSPSGQDNKQMEAFLENATYFIREIRNKRGDSAVDVFDVEAGYIFYGVANQVYMPPISEEEKAAWEKIIKENVTPQYAQHVQSNYWNSYQKEFEADWSPKGKTLPSLKNNTTSVGYPQINGPIEYNFDVIQVGPRLCNILGDVIPTQVEEMYINALENFCANAGYYKPSAFKTKCGYQAEDDTYHKTIDLMFKHNKKLATCGHLESYTIDEVISLCR